MWQIMLDELAVMAPAPVSTFSSFERADDLPTLHHCKSFRGTHLMQKKRAEGEGK